MNDDERWERVREKMGVDRLGRSAQVGIALVLIAVVLVVGKTVFDTMCSEHVTIEHAAAATDANEKGLSDATQGAGGQPDSQDAHAEQHTGIQSVPGGVVKVQIVGAVLSPGVYELEEGARVVDVVAAAGGLAPDASDQAVNLARRVVDGEQVRVLTQEEFQASEKDALNAPVNEGESGAAKPVGAKVDVNQAGAAELESLPGVGPATAAAIIEDRERNGPFASPDDLKRVSGIGDKKLARLAAFIAVG